MSAPVELLSFSVAAGRFAAPLEQVRRVDGYRPELDLGEPLGAPRARRRALVFEPAPGVERALTVDEVGAVQRVEPLQLRRLPRLAGAPRYLKGVWLDGAEPVLLVDLHATWTST